MRSRRPVSSEVIRFSRPTVAAVSAAVAFALHSAAARADLEGVKSFSIPPQSLSAALLQFSSQADVQVVGKADTLVNLDSAGVAGQHTGREALKKLLENHPLTFEEVTSRSVRILPHSSRALSAGTIIGPGGNRILLAQALMPSSAQQSASNPSGLKAGEVLEEVVVRAVSFRYEEAMSANKMPIPVKDTPQTLKIVTEDLFDFAGIQNFEDLYKIDASGDTAHSGPQRARNYYRGFLQQGINAIKVDGFRMIANIQLDLAPFERFEVVKGATSTLYGQNSIGGTLNAVSKVPQDTFGGEMSFEAGSYSHYRGELDLYGPLAADGALSYRLVGSYLDEDTYLDFVSNRRWVLAPSLRYEFGPDTSLLARATYQDFDFSPFVGFGAQFLGDDLGDPAQLTPQNFRIPDVPRSRTGNTPEALAQKDALFVQTLLKHTFEGGWNLRGSLQYNRSTEDNRGLIMFGSDRDGLVDSTLPYLGDSEDETYAAEVNLFGDVEAFGSVHTLFLGIDYAELNSHDFTPFDFLSGADTGFNFLDPDYSLITIPAAAEDYAIIFEGREKRSLGGVTAQALLRPLAALTVSLGTRYSRDVQRSQSACCDPGLPLGPVERLEEDAVTVQTGLTYALTDDLNLYASYGETFEPQAGMTLEGTRIDPEEGAAYEVGLKGDALRRQLSYSVALFHMERTNIAQSIPGTPFVAPRGTQRSQGVELDFQGEVLPGWDVYGSIAWLDAEFTEGQAKGAKAANAPDFGASLFTSYEIQGGRLQGLGFGGGVVHKSGRDFNDTAYGSLTRVELVDDYTELDLRVFYTRENWQFELAGTNLLDEKYHSNIFGVLAEAFNANPPRQFMGMIRYRLR